MHANETQIGGEHYKAPEGGQQHWDRQVQLFGWPGARPYFVGNLTAYIERYHLKNGTQDLRKAIHYLQKLIELEETLPGGLDYKKKDTQPKLTDVLEYLGETVPDLKLCLVPSRYSSSINEKRFCNLPAGHVGEHVFGGVEK